MLGIKKAANFVSSSRKKLVFAAINHQNTAKENLVFAAPLLQNIPISLGRESISYKMSTSQKEPDNRTRTAVSGLCCVAVLNSD
jgi:hypothetical protein